MVLLLTVLWYNYRLDRGLLWCSKNLNEIENGFFRGFHLVAVLNYRAKMLRKRGQVLGRISRWLDEFSPRPRQVGFLGIRMGSFGSFS